ncbi:MAG: dihydrofolate reductase [Candidatus Woesearchaeota archaeon]
MEIIIIAAVAENGVIGKDGKIPWHIKEDFMHFKKLTMGHACVMGRLTYESLPDNARPLPGRENIVLTTNRNYRAKGAKVFESWESAISYLKNREKVFVCGGASVYRTALKDANTLEITRVHTSPIGDVVFPHIDWKEWRRVNEEKHNGYSFLKYERIKHLASSPAKTPD